MAEVPWVMKPKSPGKDKFATPTDAPPESDIVVSLEKFILGC